MIRSLIKGEYRGKMGRRQFKGKTNSKIGPRTYYKGRGSRSLGYIDTKGRFHMDPSKLPVYYVPDLTDFPLKAYVSYGTPKISVPPPKVPEIDLTKTEIDILDIVAPQHKELREQRKKQLFQASQQTTQTTEQQQAEQPIN
eukprot:TRINITY_DN1440_c0_g1_i1.p1 TRINITY_DN1440_c0_g1~~TRINITY_DN1440_c0_g1_i1.p1  ORF type:complete len:141 (-),score=50.66 TRINITY_DN1440_c0_g1_i1:35-457(-)